MMPMRFGRVRVLLCLVAMLASTPFLAVSQAETGIPDSPRLRHAALWRARIQSFLDQGVIPLVDLQSSLRREDGEKYLEEALAVMDRAGVALMSLDGYQAPKEQGGGKGGYRWGDYVREVADAHPERFIPASNGGTNKNWLGEKGGRPQDFIDQTEARVRAGQHAIMGEFEFRHYMSNHQCREGRTDRDVSVPLDSHNGHRLFALSQDTGVVFLIHMEPEDDYLDQLERMLAAYPKARVIVCHFGQIRLLEKQRRFGPKLARRLLATYPNLFFDLSVGLPGRRYQCTGLLDTVLWDTGPEGQRPFLAPDYKALLTDCCERFVCGFDYGGGRGPLGPFIAERAETMRLILRDLSPEAQRNIAFGNAWRLLTGASWK